MGVVVGSTAFYSTWGRFRTAVANQDEDLDVTDHNITFNSGFKSTAGNGLLRFDPVQRIIFILQPVASIKDFGGGDAFAFEQSWSSGCVTVEDQDQLVGETVVATGDNFVINTDAFTNNLGQTAIGVATAPIITIGKLTAF